MRELLDTRLSTSRLPSTQRAACALRPSLARGRTTSPARSYRGKQRSPAILDDSVRHRRTRYARRARVSAWFTSGPRDSTARRQLRETLDEPVVGAQRHDHGNRHSAVGHTNELAATHPAQHLTGVVLQLPNAHRRRSPCDHVATSDGPVATRQASRASPASLASNRVLLPGAAAARAPEHHDARPEHEPGNTGTSGRMAARCPDRVVRASRRSAGGAAQRMKICTQRGRSPHCACPTPTPIQSICIASRCISLALQARYTVAASS